MCIFGGEKFDLPSLFQIWKFNNPCDVVKSKLVWKGTKFIYYIPTVIKRSNLISPCDINPKFGQECPNVQMLIKWPKQLFIETLRKIYWLLSTGFTNSKTVILVLTSLLLKWVKKAPYFHVLCEWCLKNCSDPKMKPNWHIKYNLW